MPSLLHADGFADPEHRFHRLLAGYTADGSQLLSPPIPFTTDGATRLFAFHLCRAVLGSLYDDPDQQDPTALYRKLLRHLNKTGIQNPERIEQFRSEVMPFLIDALKADYRRITSDLSVPAILRAYRQTLEHRANQFAKALDRPPPRPALATSGAFTLTELTHPLHLYEESRQLAHCLGYQAKRLPKELTTTAPHDPRRLQHLDYWLQIERAELRILSFRKEARSLLTLDLRPDPWRIETMSAYGNTPVYVLPHAARRHLQRTLTLLTRTLGPIHHQPILRPAEDPAILFD